MFRALLKWPSHPGMRLDFWRVRRVGVYSEIEEREKRWRDGDPVGGICNIIKPGESCMYIGVVAQYEGDKSTISFCCQFLTTDGQKSRGGILKRKENK